MEKINLNNYEAFFLDYAEGNLPAEQVAMLGDFLNTHPHLRKELEQFDMITLPGLQQQPQDWNDLKKPDVQTLETNSALRGEFFFRAAEKDLNNEEKRLLLELLKNHEFETEYLLWKKAVLLPANEGISKDELFEFGLNQPVSDLNYEYYLIARGEGLLSTAQNKDLEAFATSKPNGKKDLELAGKLKLQPARGIFFPNKEKLYKKESRPLVLWLYRAAAVAIIFVLTAFLIAILNHPFAEKANIAQDTPTPEHIDSVQKKPVLPDTASVKNKPDTEETKSENSEPQPEKINRNTTIKTQIKMAEPSASEMLRAEITLEKIEILTPGEFPLHQEKPEPVQFDLYAYEAPYRQMKQESRLMAAITSIPGAVGDIFNRKLDASEERIEALPKDFAKRFGTVSEMLNAEIKKETTQNDGEEMLTYSFRIGGFVVSHSKTK